MQFIQLTKPKVGDKVAIISPSFAAPAKWPHVYELGLERLRNEFQLVPVEYPTTKKLGATGEERAKDIIAAFTDPEIKAVIASLGGDDQVTYIYKYLLDKKDVFRANPKPFFGYSDNTQLVNFLWQSGVPSYYGGALFTDFAENGSINPFSFQYLELAMFSTGKVEIKASEQFSDEGLDWGNPDKLTEHRRYQENEGWYWEGAQKNVSGISWGGCLEALEDTMMHGQPLPTLEQFENIVLLLETSEEMPNADRVYHVLRAMGERGILKNIKGVLVGRPKAWEWGNMLNDEQKVEFKKEQREIMLEAIQKYNSDLPIVLNLDFGHTLPQIPMPMGREVVIDANNKKIFVTF